MHWKADPNGSGYRIRQFDTPAVTRSIQCIALRELSGEKEPKISKKGRQKRFLRMILPPWLEKRANEELEQMSSDMEEK